MPNATVVVHGVPPARTSGRARNSAWLLRPRARRSHLRSASSTARPPSSAPSSNRQVVDVALPLAQHDPTVPHGSSRDRRGPLGRVVKR
ncbi:hypothetical protein ACFQ60_01245 [Streptomyces zhihengii]